jgi:2-dehydro-3-deoxyphosphogluconate aldolase / (4S)-4-hydroxy-2-oxoglutarate aldolase
MSELTGVDTIMRLGPVIPVLTIEQVGDALTIAEALVAGGIRAIEVTLRTTAAIDAIREMAQVKAAVVGAGTVLNQRDLEMSLKAGAQFIVSPGLTESLGKAAIASGVPFLPGIANASDIMRGLELGLSRFKFFPATAAGGLPALKALAAPFHQCRFCPTGGITQATAAEWLALDSVTCVGGSWLVPPGKPQPATIRQNAIAAASLIKL